MSDATPWPESVPFPVAAGPDTWAVVAAIEHWRTDDPIRRSVVAAAKGRTITASISLAMGENEPPRSWSITFRKPLPTRLVLALLHELIRTAPGGPPVVVPPEPAR